jgi:hypothetical protein
MSWSDKVTGEVEEKFVKMYQRNISMVRDLSKCERNVLDRLVARYIGYGNEIVMTYKIREDLCRYAVTTNKHLTNVLGVLKKKNLLIAGNRNVYYVNPYYVFKGKISSRAEVVARLAGEDLVERMKRDVIEEFEVIDEGVNDGEE